jgi:hypothetical protein
VSSRAPVVRSRSSAAHGSGSALADAARLRRSITRPDDPFGGDLVATTGAFLVAGSSSKQAQDTGWVGIALCELARRRAATS